MRADLHAAASRIIDWAGVVEETPGADHAPLARGQRTTHGNATDIGDVRGEGLLLAFEIVSNRETREPLPPGLKAFDDLVERAYAEGLIIYSRRSRGGYSGDHFLICPPMITTEAQVDEIMEKLTRALEGFAAAHAGLLP